MRKSIFFAAAFAGVLCSCSQDEAIEGGMASGAQEGLVPIEIGVAQVKSTVTRGTGTVGTTDEETNTWAGQKFNVYMFNKQPGVTINYRTGENWANGDDAPSEQPEEVAPEDATYILNLETEKFHRPDCSSAPKVDSDSYFATDMTREDVIAFGFSPCKTCKP